MSKIINSNMEQYAIYLRKSRKDEEAELYGEGETLARHEATMLNLAKKMNIIISKIYREVVSGDSISARPVMQELLQDVENGIWTGVLVMEVERLARGNTLDQGIVSNTFKYSSTKIITPMKTYDPNNEFDEEYFEFGLFMSRREYNTIKRRLRQGVLSSVKEGKYIGSKPPYGYEKYKLKEKGWSLKVKPDEAKAIQLVYKMYTNGNNIGEICRILNELNIPPAYNEKWYSTSVRTILDKEVYIGKIKYYNNKYIKKVVNGNLVKVRNPNPEIIIVDGLHEPIIDIQTWNKAQELKKNHMVESLRTKKGYEAKNAFARLLVCKSCGKILKRKVHYNRPNSIRLHCNYCNKNISSSYYIIEEKILLSLKELLAEYKLTYKNNSVDDSIILLENINKSIEKVENDIKTSENQKSKLYDLLEQGIYDNNTFLNRSKNLAERLQQLNLKLVELLNKKDHILNLKNKKENLIPKIQNVIDTYYETDDISSKNKLLRSVLEKIAYYKEKGNKPDEFELILYPKL